MESGMRAYFDGLVNLTLSKATFVRVIVDAYEKQSCEGEPTLGKEGHDQCLNTHFVKEQTLYVLQFFVVCNYRFHPHSFQNREKQIKTLFQDKQEYVREVYFMSTFFSDH